MRLKYYGPHTQLGWLNVLIIQWLFIRLQATVDDNMKIDSLKVIGLVLPLTGWSWSFWAPNYVWIWRL